MVALFSSPLSHRVAYPTFWNPKMRYFQFHWKRNLLDAYQSAAKHGASCNLLCSMCQKNIWGQILGYLEISVAIVYRFWLGKQT